MKAVFTLIALIAINISGWSNRKIASFEKLITVNKEWRNQPDVALNNLPIISETNNRELIAKHLELVEHYLGTRDISHLSDEQKYNRQQALIY